MSIEAMKQALEALELTADRMQKQRDAITALRAAIAEASMQRLTDVQQEMGATSQESRQVEPVAYVTGYSKGYATVQPIDPCLLMPVGMGLYRSPPTINEMETVEPVAWKVAGEVSNWSKDFSAYQTRTYVEPVYAHPPRREWVGLTDEDVMVAAYQAGFDIHEDYDNDDTKEMHWWTPDGEVCDDSLLKLRDIIEAKLKENNS